MVQKLVHRARRPLRTCKKPGGAVDSAINVTPLVDVVLVLLIIFMVVTPSRERRVSVQVPTSATLQANEPPPQQLVVALGASSEITLDRAPVDDASYVDELRARLRQRADPVVFFVAADGASYQKLVLAMDGARRAGATRLAFVTDTN